MNDKWQVYMIYFLSVGILTRSAGSSAERSLWRHSPLPASGVWLHYQGSCQCGFGPSPWSFALSSMSLQCSSFYHFCGCPPAWICPWSIRMNTRAAFILITNVCPIHQPKRGKVLVHSTLENWRLRWQTGILLNKFNLKNLLFIFI